MSPGARAPVCIPIVLVVLATTALASTDDGRQMLEDIRQQEEVVLSGRDGLDYDPAGRRDPFVDPRKVQDPKERRQPPDGLGGMLIQEVRLQGISLVGDQPIAIVLGTDNLGYFVREGDELWDGKVDRIDFDQDSVVFQQRVTDPGAEVRFRDVARALHPERKP